MICHCCGKSIYGCTGSVAFPDGVPFENPRFHCDHCTEALVRAGLAGSECDILIRPWKRKVA